MRKCLLGVIVVCLEMSLMAVRLCWIGLVLMLGVVRVRNRVSNMVMMWWLGTWGMGMAGMTW